MSVLYPAFLWAGAGLSIAIVALHWISTRWQSSTSLPTFRFVPEEAPAARSLTRALSDGRLLAYRLAILVLASLALSQPDWRAPSGTGRVLLVDGSASVERGAFWRYAVLTAGADAIVFYDERAETVAPGELEARLERPASTAAVGNLSGALLAALREGEALLAGFEAVELQIVAPFLQAAFDAATPSLRRLWSGEIVATPVPSAPDGLPRQPVLLHWPEAARAPADIWRARAAPVEPGGIHSAIATIVAPIERTLELADPSGSGTTAVAWWLDGEPAVMERLEDGVRHVFPGFTVSSLDDTELRPSFVRVRQWLGSETRAPAGMVSLAPAELERFVGGRETEEGERITAVPRPVGWLAPGLLALAILLLLGEPFLRRRLQTRAKIS